MQKIDNSGQNGSVRTLDETEIDIVSGGVERRHGNGGRRGGGNGGGGGDGWGWLRQIIRDILD